MSSAKLAFDTLTAQTAEAAEVAATKLESLNKERQSIFKDSYKEAEQIAKSMIDDQCNVLVVASDAWLPGIVGLIAGRLVNDFALPAFALTKVGDHYVGSGRTAGGLHLVEAMNACGDIFIKKGGHPQACGLSVRTMDDVHEFRTQMNVFARSKFGANGPSVTLPIDAVVTPSTFTIDSLGELNACAPFGEGNRPPIFAALKLTVMIAETMGSTGTHLRLTVLDDAGKVSKMIGFGMGDKAEELVRGRQIDIAYEPGINEWNGRKDVQCRIVDIRL